MQGQVSDIAIHAQEILRMRSSLNEIYASHTGQSVDVIGEQHYYNPPYSVQKHEVMQCIEIWTGTLDVRTKFD